MIQSEKEVKLFQLTEISSSHYFYQKCFWGHQLTDDTLLQPTSVALFGQMSKMEN